MLEASNRPPAFLTLENSLTAAEGAFAWPPMWMSPGGTLSMDQVRDYLTTFELKVSGWPVSAGGAFPRFHDIYAEAGVAPSFGYLDDNNGDTLRETLSRAMTNATDFIQVATWNDYGEGTIIEPTREYGFRELESVQDLRRQLEMGTMKLR